MPALFIYLIKVNVALLIFCAGYYAVLRHLTFYNINRVYLVNAIICSTLYPALNITEYINRHNEIARPIQVIVVNWQEPVKTIVKTFLGHDQWYWLQAAFWLGVIIFAVRLLTQLLSLYRLHKLSEPVQLHQYMIRVIKGNINPFSFWRNIYINPDNHAANELDAILEHEQIHVNEWHTLDILLGEVSAIFYWFNPGIWLMKRAIRENIEFITDQKILQKGVDSKAYQYSLLNVNFGAQGNTIVNHFNISTIKKRIMMMNAKRSSSINITRYLFLIPAVMVLLLIFSVSKAELNKAVKGSAHMIKAIKTEITKISFINTKPTATHSTTGFLSAVSLFKIDSDTTAKRKPEKTLTINYSFSYDSAGKSDSKEFHLLSTTDTNKKKSITIKGLGDKKPDIYINGVKNDNLENLNSDDVYSVNIDKDEKSHPNGAVYIITKDHAPKGTFSIGGIGGKADSVIVVQGRSTNGGRVNRVTASSGFSANSTGNSGYNRITKVKINGKIYDATGEKTTKTVINGDTIYTTAALTAARAKLPVIDSLVSRLNGVSIDANGVVTRVVTGYKTGPARIVNVRASAAPISFENKLILIDGKEATAKQLKKVSADKIISVNNLSGDAATATYGDKAKNGVVVITTKK